MNWIESFANAVGMGVLAATAAAQLFEYWRRQDPDEARRKRRAAEASASMRGDSWEQAHATRWAPMHAATDPEALRQLDPELLQRLAQHMDVTDLITLFVHPRLALGLSDRDFTEADYEALLRLDDGVRTRQPVSEAQIDALPVHVHAAPPRGGGGDCGGLGTCSVCLDDFGDGAVVRTLPCLHHFHDACVDPWLRQQGLAAPCPVCKTPVFQAP